MAKETVSVLGATTLTLAAERATHPTKIDLTGKNWLNFYLEATVTNGSTGPIAGTPVNIFYATSNQSITAGLAPVALAARKKAFKMSLSNTASLVYQFASDTITVKGDYLYVWIDHNVLTATVSLVLGAVAMTVQPAVV